jgi:hypothetical protein
MLRPQSCQVFLDISVILPLFEISPDLLILIQNLADLLSLSLPCLLAPVRPSGLRLLLFLVRVLGHLDLSSQAIRTDLGLSSSVVLLCGGIVLGLVSGSEVEEIWSDKEVGSNDNNDADPVLDVHAREAPFEVALKIIAPGLEGTDDQVHDLLRIHGVGVWNVEVGKGLLMG